MARKKIDSIYYRGNKTSAKAVAASLKGELVPVSTCTRTQLKRFGLDKSQLSQRMAWAILVG